MKNQPVYVGTSPSDVRWTVYDGNVEKIEAQRRMLRAMWARQTDAQVQYIVSRAAIGTELRIEADAELRRRVALAREVKKEQA
jgi:hypothetical protein